MSACCADSMERTFGYCYNCKITTLPYTQLNDNEFQNTLNEFQFCPSQLGRHSRMDQQRINPFNLHNKYTI